MIKETLEERRYGLTNSPFLLLHTYRAIPYPDDGNPASFKKIKNSKIISKIASK